eukprot:9179461-Heterocapsa_arctica.AAC.1
MACHDRPLPRWSGGLEYASPQAYSCLGLWTPQWGRDGKCCRAAARASAGTPGLRCRTSVAL